MIGALMMSRVVDNEALSQEILWLLGMRCADNAVERIYGESQHELNCMVTLIVGTNELPSVFRLQRPRL